MKLDDIVKLPRKLPSDTYRAGDKDFEKARGLFYSRIAAEYGFERWDLPTQTFVRVTDQPERDRKIFPGKKIGARGSKVFWTAASGSLEMLEMNCLLNSKIENPRTARKMTIAMSEGKLRIETGHRLRGLWDGAAIGGLKAVDFEAAPAGGFARRHVSDHALDCHKIIRDLRNNIPAKCLHIIETVIIADEMPWLGQDRKKADRILQAIRYALDFAAHQMGLDHKGWAEIDKPELCARWPEAAQFFYQRDLRPALHCAKVIRR